MMVKVLCPANNMLPFWANCSGKHEKEAPKPKCTKCGNRH